MAASKAVFFWLLVLSVPSPGQGLHVVITPLWDDLACEFRPENEPAVVKHELVRFRVHAFGGSNFRWRLPLYRTRNGATEMRVARIGAVALNDRRSFTIDVAVTDLERAREAEALELELTSPNGKSTTCATAVPTLRRPADTPRPPQLAMPGVVGLPAPDPRK